MIKGSKILVTGGSGFIGTNFQEIFKKFSGNLIINVDLVPSKVEADHVIWEECNIMDSEKLESIFLKHQPDYVFHLAAETVTEEDFTLEDYKVNIEGAENVFNAANRTASVKGLIHTSTQFANQTDFPLKNFYDFKPHTVYGESKVASEKILIEKKYNFSWVIIRPTNVWGKWHLRYPTQFWRVLREGKYVHPDKKDVIRSYAYVGNVCDQVMHFLINIERLNKEIFYVGDEPMVLYNWVNAFSLALRGKKVRVVPKELVYFLALCGNALKLLKVNFPITTSRYRSMTLSNPAPMQKTFEEVGRPKISLEEGVRVTAEWLNNDVYG